MWNWDETPYDVIESRSARPLSRQPKEVGPSIHLLEHQHTLRDIEDAYIGRNSRMRNVETLLRSLSRE